MSKTSIVLFVIILSLALPSSQAQTPRPPLITGPVDSSALRVLPGSKHVMAQPRFDVGAVDPSLKMARVLLVLSPPQSADSELQALLDRQQDRRSPDYHHWLTPEEFGVRFGPSPQDVLAIKGWLEQQGIAVTAIAKSGRWMELSATSGQIERTFQTQMRQYQVAGETHIANATEISIPTALAPVVRGVASLHNFFKKPMAARYFPARPNGDGTYKPVSPNATLTTPNGPLHALAPGDYAKIYDLSPLYSASLTGTGVNIGLVARSDVNPSDFTQFRVVTNLPLGNFLLSVLTEPPDPGFDPNSGDSIEASLDTQWAGAVAPGATIQAIVSASTATTDGVDLSSAYAVDRNLVDVLSVSFGECEADLGSAENAFFNSLWQQAAAQGMSVFVSTGDSGAAGCDPPQSNTPALGGLAVSGLASTPFNTAVGGTQFSEGGNDATFWNATNGPGIVSVNGYIPETVWNESCNPNTVGSPCAGRGFFFDAGSGGKSLLYAKPSWQIGFPATPTDTSRDIPDVSLSAAVHDGYLICFNSSCNQSQVGIVGGTSASSPSFAGIMAIVVQALGRQGLPNYGLYRIARGASASCSSSARTSPTTPAPAGCVFNDVTTGNNSVPGLTGFSATSGFDLATGLGSVDAANLVAAWKNLTSVPSTTTLTSSGGTTITAAHGADVSLTINVTGPSAPAPTGVVALNSSLTGTVGSVTLTSPSAGSTGSFTGSVNSLPGGTYSLTAQYAGDSQTAPSTSGPVSVTISPESSSTSFTVFGISAQGFPVQTTSFPYGSFMELHSAVTAVSGNGVATGAVDFKDTTAGADVDGAQLNGKGEADLFMIPHQPPLPPAALAPGTHALVASYLGDASLNASTSAPVSVTITKGNPSVVLSLGGVVQYVATQPAVFRVAILPLGPINPTGTVQLLDGGVALGSPVALGTPFSGQADVTVTFQTQGTHSITASYSGDATYNAAVSPATSIVAAPPFEFGSKPPGTTVSVAAGQTATFNLLADASSQSTPTNFTGTIALTCSGAPAGTTCAINPTSATPTPTSIAVPFTVTVTTTTSASLHKLPFRGLPVVFAAVLAILISAKAKNRQQRLQIMFVALVALAVTSCGGGTKTVTPSPTPVAPTQAVLTVTGTSGNLSNSINLNLTITH